MIWSHLPREGGVNLAPEVDKYQVVVARSGYLDRMTFHIALVNESIDKALLKGGLERDIQDTLNLKGEIEFVGRGVIFDKHNKIKGERCPTLLAPMFVKNPKFRLHVFRPGIGGRQFHRHQRLHLQRLLCRGCRGYGSRPGCLKRSLRSTPASQKKARDILTSRGLTKHSLRCSELLHSAHQGPFCLFGNHEYILYKCACCITLKSMLFTRYGTLRQTLYL